MKKPYKILLFFVSLAGCVLSAGILSLFYPVAFITEKVRAWLAFYPWLNSVFFTYMLLVCLGFFLVMLAALLVPGKLRDLTLVKGKGRLLFSKQAVESTVQYSFADVEDINYRKVRVKLGRQPEKTRVYVKLSVSDTTKLVGLTQTVQEKIDSALKSSLNIDARSIDVKVAESAAENTSRKETAAEAEKSGRVV